jgi:dTMP kinase
MGKIKDPEERKKFLDWLNGFEYGILGIPKPDLTILLHVPADIGFDLIAKKDERAYLNGKVRDIHEGDREHLRAAEDAYLSLAALDTVENWKLLQCVQDGRLLSIEEVQERVWDTVSHLFTPSSTP